MPSQSLALRIAQSQAVTCHLLGSQNSGLHASGQLYIVCNAPFSIAYCVKNVKILCKAQIAHATSSTVVPGSQQNAYVAKAANCRSRAGQSCVACITLAV